MAGYSLSPRALEKVKRSVAFTDRTSQNGRIPQPHYRTPAVPERWWTCRNDDTVELPAYGVVEVDDEDEESGEIIYVIKKLGTTWPKRVALLGERAVEPDGYAAITFEPALALCDAAAVPGPKEAWGIKPNETKLFKGYPGFRAMGRTQGVGSDQRALFRQAWPQVLWAVAGSNIPARSGATPGSGTVTIQTLASGSFVSTGFTVGVVNASGAAVVASKYLQIVEIEDVWASNYEDCAGA
jgi:hypothetical protein